MQVDVASARHPSAGQREIVVTLEECLIRLPVESWQKAYGRLQNLDHSLYTVIDLCIPQLAISR